MQFNNHIPLLGHTFTLAQQQSNGDVANNENTIYSIPTQLEIESELNSFPALFTTAFIAQWGELVCEPNHPVVIEGLSLIKCIIQNSKLDRIHGGETLHTIYLAEFILKKLQLSISNEIVIALFDSLISNQTIAELAASIDPRDQIGDEQFSTQFSGNRLAAEILKLHFYHICGNEKNRIKVCAFPSWKSKEWLDFVDKRHPSLVFADVPQDNSEADENNDWIPYTSQLRVLILDILSSRIRVASTNFRFVGFKMQTFELYRNDAILKTIDYSSLSKKISSMSRAQCSHNNVLKIECENATAHTVVMLSALATVMGQSIQGNPSAASNINKSDPEFIHTISCNPQDVIHSLIFASKTELDIQQLSQLCKCFLLHHHLINTMSLEQRLLKDSALKLSDAGNDAVSLFLGGYALPALLNVLQSDSHKSDLGVNLADLIDGRLFFALVSAPKDCLESAEAAGLDEYTAAQIEIQWNQLLRATSSNSVPFWPINFESVWRAASTAYSQESSLERQIMTLKSLDNRFVNALTEDINARGKDAHCIVEQHNSGFLTGIHGNYDFGGLIECEGQEGFERFFPGDVKRKKIWEQNMIQRYYSFLAKFSKTLENASVRTCTQVVMARSDGFDLQTAIEKKKGKKTKKTSSVGKRGNAGKKGVSKRDAIIAKNSEKISDKDIQMMNGRIKIAAASSKNKKEQIKMLNDYLRTIKDNNNAVKPLLLGMVTLIDWLMEDWKEECAKNSSKKRDYSSAANAVRLIYDLCHLYPGDLTPDYFNSFYANLVLLGFTEAADKLREWYGEVKGAEAVTQTVGNPKLISRKREPEKYNTNQSFSRFQLLYAGHLMQRKFDSREDDRVKGFQPDGWQRELLDVVYQRKSALIIAPTSSGKTLASYCAINVTLERNKREKGPAKRVVYVCPNRSLASQVMFDIYGRYGPVVGIEYENYRHNADSQVLITGPQVLVSKLLDGDFSKLLDYCILDEIHCIDEIYDSEGRSDISAAWEQIIRLLPCPFVALSATIGNPEQFHSWLQRSEELHGRTIQLITHKYRWSDLKLHVYAPPTTLSAVSAAQSFVHCKETKSANAIKPLHPLVYASIEEIASPTLLESITLAPDECLQLYDAMNSVKNGEGETLVWKSVDPDKFFGNDNCITRDTVYTWESKLKGLLRDMIAENKSSTVEAVLQKLAGKDHGEGVEYPSEPGFAEQQLIFALTQLNSQNQLPAIVFTFERLKANRTLSAIIQVLREKENKERSTPEYQEKIKEQQKKRAAYLKEQKRQRDKDTEERKNELEEPYDEEPAAPPPENDGPDPKYCFTPIQDRMSEESVEYWLKRIWKRSGDGLTNLLVEGLSRGIGVHHSAVPTSYRQAVEVMFRAGHLKVVIATGTLALGINMPCKTVVFMDDSPFLTPLMYRQMSGRAGRRGFDDVGQVVFLGFPKHRIHSLLVAPLSSIVGIQPVSLSLTLKMVLSLGNLKEATKEQMVTNYKKLLIEPLFTTAVENEIEKKSFIHHTKLLFRLYLGLLHENQLMNDEANPINLAILANLVAQKDPANLFMCYLFSSGAIDHVCQTFSQDREYTARKLLHLIATVFNTVPVLPQTSSMKKVKVSLPSLDITLQNISNMYNKSILNLYTSYFSRMLGRPILSRALPLSGATNSLNESRKFNDSSKLYKMHMENNILAIVLRSPFVALSGHGDIFTDAQDMADSANEHFKIQSNEIPITSVYCDVSGTPLQLNSYALNYYMRPSKSMIRKYHGLKEGRAWQLLNEIGVVLQVLKNFTDAVSEITTLRNSNALHCLKYLNEEFQRQFKHFNDEH